MKAKSSSNAREGLGRVLLPSHGYVPRMQTLSILHRVWEEEEKSLSEIHEF